MDAECVLHGTWKGKKTRMCCDHTGGAVIVHRNVWCRMSDSGVQVGIPVELEERVWMAWCHQEGGRRVRGTARLMLVMLAAGRGAE